jgi:hypothetical protein
VCLEEGRNHHAIGGEACPSNAKLTVPLAILIVSHAGHQVSLNWTVPSEVIPLRPPIAIPRERREVGPAAR